MAFQHDGRDYTYLAAADLSAKQFFAVKFAPGAARVVPVAAATDRVVGFVQNKPRNGEAATVRVDGGTKAIAGAAIAEGAEVQVSADGRVVTRTTGLSLGVCELGAGAANDVVSISMKVPGVVQA